MDESRWAQKRCLLPFASLWHILIVVPNSSFSFHVLCEPSALPPILRKSVLQINYISCMEEKTVGHLQANLWCPYGIFNLHHLVIQEQSIKSGDTEELPSCITAILSRLHPSHTKRESDAQSEFSHLMSLGISSLCEEILLATCQLNPGHFLQALTSHPLFLCLVQFCVLSKFSCAKNLGAGLFVCWVLFVCGLLFPFFFFLFGFVLFFNFLLSRR